MTVVPKYLKIWFEAKPTSITRNGDDLNYYDNMLSCASPSKYSDDEIEVCFTIDIEKGTVLNWTEFEQVTIYSKVSDSGIYTFFDKDLNTLTAIEDYVLDGLDIDDDGFSDYIILTIDELGNIKNWNSDKLIKEYNKYRSQCNCSCGNCCCKKDQE